MLLWSFPRLWIWRFPEMEVPQIIHIQWDFMGFSIINQPFWGSVICGNLHILKHCHLLTSPWAFGQNPGHIAHSHRQASSSGKVSVPKGARTCTRAKSSGTSRKSPRWRGVPTKIPSEDQKYVTICYNMAVVYHLCSLKNLIHVFCSMFSFMCHKLSIPQLLHMANHLDSLCGIYGIYGLSR